MLADLTLLGIRSHDGIRRQVRREGKNVDARVLALTDAILSEALRRLRAGDLPKGLDDAIRKKLQELRKLSYDSKEAEHFVQELRN